MAFHAAAHTRARCRFCARCRTGAGGKLFSAWHRLPFRNESHANPKNFYCPDPSCQEINIGGFVADISDSSGITEIQTRGFGKLRRKLQCFLPNYPVRIVLPIAAVRWLIWVDPQSGELLSRRRCAPGSPLLLFRELYSILDLLWPDSLRVTLAMLECEEYRLKDGRGPDGKKGAHRSQLLPLRLMEEIELSCPARPADPAAAFARAVPLS